MIQDYLFGLDPITSAQVITIILFPVSLMQYFMPQRSASKIGLDSTNPIVLWFVERTGIIHLQMALSMICLFFFDMNGRDAMTATFLVWGFDSMRTAFYREVLQVRSGQVPIPGIDEIQQCRGHRVDLLLISLTLLGWYQDKAWFETAMTVEFCWFLYNGFKFVTMPNQAWSQWGIHRGRKKHLLSGLGRIHAGSYAEMVSFGTILFFGIAPHRALGYALTLKLIQMLTSQFIFNDDKVLHINTDAWTFWILVYIPIIFSLLG